MPASRRSFLAASACSMIGLSLAAPACRAAPAQAAPAQVAQSKLARVIIDNDFAGDPDGLFQLAHHVLSRAITIPLIIGSHLPASFASGHDAKDSAQRASELLAIMKLDQQYRPIAGAEQPIRTPNLWQPSEASRAIVREAMREDVKEPLVFVAGAGLTDLALAWLSEPRIGPRIKLIWIGGKPHPDLSHAGHAASKHIGPNKAKQPVAEAPEFNFSIDPVAAQIIFNQSDIEIWQVPSSAYTQMLYSMADMEELAASGPLGAYLKARVEAMAEMIAHIPGLRQPPLSDVYVLGDSPLVTLTTMLPPMQPDTTSSRHVVIPTPQLMPDGSYRPRSTARPMRVYTQIDAALTFSDMTARFHLHQAGKL